MSEQVDLLPGQYLRTMQIIAGALFLGVAAFLAIVLFIVLVQGNGQGMAPPVGLPILSLVLVGLFIVTLPLAFIIPGVLTQAALRRIATRTWRPPLHANPIYYSSDAAKLLTVRQTATIIGLAILEGTAFFGCIAYLLEAQAFALGVIIVAMLLMLLNFPTEGRVRGWLERQTDCLAELRQQAGSAAEQ
jgi:hypothetical protein